MKILVPKILGAVAHRLGARAHQGQVRAGLRLGEVHRAGPGSRRSQQGCRAAAARRAGRHQRLHRAVGQQRAQRKSSCSPPHISPLQARGNGLGRPCPPNSTGCCSPASRLRRIAERVLEARGRDLPSPSRGVLVALVVQQRRDHVLASAARIPRAPPARSRRQSPSNRQRHGPGRQCACRTACPSAGAAHGLVLRWRTKNRHPGAQAALWVAGAGGTERLTTARARPEQVGFEAVVGHAEKIGASGSLLIATMTLESFMPARCWMAPEMPHRDVQLGRDDLAGLADLPVVGRVAGVHRCGWRRGRRRACRPAGRTSLNFAAAQRAAAGDDDLGGGQFGRSLLAILAPTKADLPLSATAAIVSTAALPPAAAGSKPVVRTVMTFWRRGSARWRWRCRRRSALEGVGADDLHDIAQLATSSLAATRGATFCRWPWPGTAMWLFSAGQATLRAATFRPGHRRGRRRRRACTLATPGDLRGLRGGPALWPAMSTCTSPPHWRGAVTVLRSPFDGAALSCSAMTSAVICRSSVRSPSLRS